MFLSYKLSLLLPDEQNGTFMHDHSSFFFFFFFFCCHNDDLYLKVTFIQKEEKFTIDHTAKTTSQ